MKAAALPAEYTSVSESWAWLGIARCWAIVACSLLLVTMSEHALAWGLAIPAIGLAQYHLSVLGHHATHRNLFATLERNDRVARWLILAPLGLPVSITRQNHFRHHTHFETPEDYEWGIYDMSQHKASSGHFVRWLVSIYTGFAFALGVKRVLLAMLTGGGTRTRQSTDRVTSLREWAVVAFVQLALLAAFTLITGSIFAYPLLWLLPITTVMAGLSATRACLEHATLDDPPERLMTFPHGLMQGFVLGPFNFNFHAEHHRYPGVPACGLGRLHHHLAATGALGETKLCGSYLERIGIILRGLRAQAAQSGLT